MNQTYMTINFGLGLFDYSSVFITTIFLIIINQYTLYLILSEIFKIVK
jgi:hypothetical protein